MKTNIILKTFAIAVLTLSLTQNQALARIKLVTLPERDAIKVRLDNKTFTLIEEERTIALNKGINEVDFSWVNTNIIKDSIQFRPIESQGEITVINVSYPPNENSLVWKILAIEAGPAKIRITYLMNDINCTENYQAIADNSEKFMTLKYYSKVQNHSGEDFEDAQLHLWYNSDFIKDLENGESKQMLIEKFENIPIKKSYTFDPGQYGPETIPMHYVINNVSENGLGKFPLREGKARIFQEDSQKQTAFLGEDWAPFTPVGGEMKLYLGVARDIKVEKKKMLDEKINRRGRNGYVYDTDERWELIIENFKNEPAVLDVYEHINGPWDMAQISHEWEKKDANTIVIHVNLPPNGQKVALKYEIHRRNIWDE